MKLMRRIFPPGGSPTPSGGGGTVIAHSVDSTVCNLGFGSDETAVIGVTPDIVDCNDSITVYWPAGNVVIPKDTGAVGTGYGWDELSGDVILRFPDSSACDPDAMTGFGWVVTGGPVGFGFTDPDPTSIDSTC